MLSYLDVRYGPLDAHTLDLYVPDDAHDAPLIVFVHGGAWRAGDKSEHGQLAVRIALNTGCPVAVPNYRLTRDDLEHTRHPTHAEDILAASTFLHREHSLHIHFIGHSCGAHILASIFLSSAQYTPSLTPSNSLLSATRSITLSEGIFDLDALIDSFPAYDDWFVRNAFGDAEESSRKRYAATEYPLFPNGEHIQWHILHSRNDTLVDLRQSVLMTNHLQELHNAIDPGRGNAKVIFDADSLTQEHDEMMKSEAYSDLVGRYIKDCFL